MFNRLKQVDGHNYDTYSALLYNVIQVDPLNSKCNLVVTSKCIHIYDTNYGLAELKEVMIYANRKFRQPT